MVGEPTGDIARVFGHQRELAGLEVQVIGVKELLVALVETDQHLVGEIAQTIDDLRFHSLEWRHVFKP